ncbi:glycosyltransferase family 2 protein [Bacteroides sp.]|jgi:glycosyltransferase involved in cell wall biosynthesis|uniref:glycosyltransferase family 2 protein n=1 Tax=Bacteroides sp. TaxID=29523 RepID=UPI0025BE3253|nr:glycosyltransferase family 2 protein [Bacteroides sp.]
MKKEYNPLVSFIIPCYNVESYIEQCINSIINQIYKNIEIIAVDDGSPDTTGVILDQLAVNDLRIKVIHKKNGGVSTARNVGIEAASGDYIVFVDGDDYISSDYTDYMIGMIKQYDAEMALSVNCYMREGEHQVLQDNIKCYTPEDATTLLLSPRVIVGSWDKIYKRDLLIDNNIRFSQTQFYGEGLLFITSATQFANRIAVGNRRVYYYRRNNYSSVCTNFNMNNFYNGSDSIDIIEESLRIRTRKVLGMLGWHRCQFKMGTVVRIKEAKKVEEFKEYYNVSLAYVRKHTWECLSLKGVSLYKKLLLVGTCVSPWLMAKLDRIRRNNIEKHSA